MGNSVVNKLVNTIVESAKAQDDPRNRTVSEIHLDADDSIENCQKWNVLITSDCDGWAVDTKVIATVYNEPTKDSLEKLVGSTEAAVLDAFPETVENSLCVVLDRLFSHPELFDYDDEELRGQRFADVTTPLGNLAEELAAGFFITANGSCNWSNILKVKKHGYDVYAGEQDSFGWLVGCIEKEGMVLCYG